MNVAAILRALANERRLQILDWLRDPRALPAPDGRRLSGGRVCGALIAEKLGVGAPTLSEHMRVLVGAGLVRAKRVKQWTMYRPTRSRSPRPSAPSRTPCDQ
jgi:ArsR family transcriptional regulator